MQTNIYTHAHTYKCIHKHAYPQTYKNRIPKADIHQTPPSSSKRAILTMMYPVEDTTDHIDPRLS